MHRHPGTAGIIQHRLSILLVCLLMAACSPLAVAQTAAVGTSPTLPSPQDPGLLSSPTTLPTLPPLPTVQPSPLPSPTPAPAPRSQYRLSAIFDYAQHSVDVQEEVSFANPWPEPLSSLVLVVEPNHYPGAFSLLSISLDGAVLSSPGQFTLDGHRLEIPLPSPLAYLAGLGVNLSYRLALPAIPPPADNRRPVPFGYTNRQTNLVDWYPYVAAYQSGVGWLLHDAWVFGEHEVYDPADYQVDLQVTAAPQGLVLAASAPAAALAGSRYHFEMSSSRSFAISASPDYVVSSQTVGGVTVFAYTFTWDKTAGEAALRDSARAVEVYSQLFGAFPRSQMSLVEADFLDGMEYDGLFFLSRGFYNLYDGTPKGYLTAIAVHETAHQWWFALVGNDQALDPWLDEGMSTYAERLFYEQVYPALSDWWWAFRISFYDPQGWVNHPIYDYSSFTAYRNAVYLRGASFLEDLRIQMGDEAFFSMLKELVSRFTHQRVTPHDFFALVHQHTSINLDPLLKIYFDPQTAQ